MIELQNHNPLLIMFGLLHANFSLLCQNNCMHHLITRLLDIQNPVAIIFSPTFA